MKTNEDGATTFRESPQHSEYEIYQQRRSNDGADSMMKARVSHHEQESTLAAKLPMGGGEPDYEDTSNGSLHEKEETVSEKQPRTDDPPNEVGCPSRLLLEEDVGEIDIDDREYEQDEDDEDSSVGFHPIDTTSVFRARPA
jgi:hypothetical protein